MGAGQKRPRSAEGIAAEIASHANHTLPNQRLPLPPVEPSKQLKSSPGLLATPRIDCLSASDHELSASGRSPKKVCRSAAAQEPQGQTATPPPSTHKGSRKLVPKLDVNAMQNDQGFDQPDFMGNPHQPAMGNFVTTPSDVFNYPLSAPATVPSYENQRSFWDADAGMGGMDMDFGTNGSGVFQNANSAHPSMESVDWTRANQFLQETSMVHDEGGDDRPTGEGMHSITSQASMQTLGTTSAEQSMFAAAYPPPFIDPFGIINRGGGAVDPGLIFSRPPSSSMDMPTFSASLQNPGIPAPMMARDAQTGKRPLAAKAPVRGELRRSASEVEIVPKKQDRSSTNSPVKGRLGLARSFSENRGKKPVNRASLPTLAPAPRPQSQILGSSNRPIISQPNRPNGRSSPLKSQHQRLPSLSSIPETAGPRTRTQAKFTIDANGRARVETTIIVDDEPPPTVRKRPSAQSVTRHRRCASSEDDDSSSTDDEPIIIPSRNTSFALPDPQKPTTIHPFHNSQRSISERSVASYTTFRGSRDEEDSDRETIINDLTPTGKVSGDAASELRKLRESRRGQSSSAKMRRLVTSGAGPGTGGSAGNYSRQTVISPTTLTGASLPTPSTGSRTRGIRCVCNRTEAYPGNGFLVQWYECPVCRLAVA